MGSGKSGELYGASAKMNRTVGDMKGAWSGCRVRDSRIESSGGTENAPAISQAWRRRESGVSWYVLLLRTNGKLGKVVGMQKRAIQQMARHKHGSVDV